MVQSVAEAQSVPHALTHQSQGVDDDQGAPLDRSADSSGDSSGDSEDDSQADSYGKPVVLSEPAVGRVVGPSSLKPDGAAVSLLGYYWDDDPLGAEALGRLADPIVGEKTTRPRLPYNAEPLGLADIYVVPFDTFAWDFDPEGRPAFIVRNSDAHFEWRLCDRDLRPIEARVIPGLKRVESRDAFKKGQFHPRIVYLGENRWWVSGNFPFDLGTVIYNAGTDTSLQVPLTEWLDSEQAPSVSISEGDGHGGAVLDVYWSSAKRPFGLRGALLSIGPRGELRWKIETERGQSRNKTLPQWNLLQVTDTNQILIRDRDQNRFRVLDAEGNTIRTLDFSDLGREPDWVFSGEPAGPHHYRVDWESKSDDDGRPTQYSSRIIDVEAGVLLTVEEAFGANADRFASGQMRSDGALWIGGGRGSQATWHSSELSKRLQRVDRSGNVVESLSSKVEPAYVSAPARKPHLLGDGRVVALNAELPELLLREVDGTSVRWERQGLDSWATAAVDAAGALWITNDAGLVLGADGAATRGWSRDGELLGDFVLDADGAKLNVSGRLAFDPRGERVWSWTTEPTEAIETQGDSDKGAPSTAGLKAGPGHLRLFAFNAGQDPRLDGERAGGRHGGLVVEHTTYSIGGESHAFGALRQFHVDESGIAYVWLDAPKGSILVRFGPDGVQLDAYAWTDFQVATGAGCQRGTLVLGMLDPQSPWTVAWSVALDVANPRARLYRMDNSAVLDLAESFGLSPDGNEVWNFLDSPPCYVRRPLSSSEWKPVKRDQ